MSGNDEKPMRRKDGHGKFVDVMPCIGCGRLVYKVFMKTKNTLCVTCKSGAWSRMVDERE